jgi:hypothetical protein
VKAKRILAACCVALSLCLLVAIAIGISTVDHKAYGSIAQSAPVFGNSQIVLTQSGTGTTVLNLSGTAATSIPCFGMVLSNTNSNVLIGSSSGSCTFPLPTGQQSLDKQVSNVNQVWCSLSNSTTGTVTATVSAVYAQ